MKSLSLILIIIISLCFPVKSQWQELVSPTTNPLYSVSVVNNSVAWICGRNGTVLRTTDGGADWNVLGSGFFQNYVHLFTVYALDDQTAFVSYHQGGIGDITELFKTTDGGANWIVVFEQTGGWIMDMRMFTQNTGFLYTSPLNSSWRFFNTSDGGNIWSPISSYPEQGFVESGHYNSTYVSGNEIFFGSTTGNIYHSIDAGYSWSLIPITQSNTYAIWFNTPSDGLAGGDNAMETTTDGGGSWSLLSSLNGLDSASAITGFNNDWWVANQNIIYHSDDDRVSWTTQYTAPSGKFIHMAKARSGNLIVAVRDNGGISAYLAPVPVELVSFNAIGENETVNLYWRTASEINNSGFVVQRSAVADHQNEASTPGWKEIGFVEGNGTTIEENYYSFSDRNLVPGVYSYRLLQMDLDGTTTRSGVVEVEVNTRITEYSLKQNYPNPFNPATSIQYSVGSRQHITLKVYNVLGKEVATLVNEEKTPGTYSVEFNGQSDNGQDLSSGVYIYKLTAVSGGSHPESYTVVKKMLLIK